MFNCQKCGGTPAMGVEKEEWPDEKTVEREKVYCCRCDEDVFLYGTTETAEEQWDKKQIRIREKTRLELLKHVLPHLGIPKALTKVEDTLNRLYGKME